MVAAEALEDEVVVAEVAEEVRYYCLQRHSGLYGAQLISIWDLY